MFNFVNESVVSDILNDFTKTVHTVQSGKFEYRKRRPSGKAITDKHGKTM